MTDHLATGMKRMIRTVARSASLSDRLGEQSRLLRLTGNRSTLDFRPAEHGASSWDFEMSITPTEPKPYGNAETREPVWRETVDSATYGESRARVAHAVETFRIYDSTGFLPETEIWPEPELLGLVDDLTGRTDETYKNPVDAVPHAAMALD